MDLGEYGMEFCMKLIIILKNKFIYEQLNAINSFIKEVRFSLG